MSLSSASVQYSFLFTQSHAKPSAGEALEYISEVTDGDCITVLAHTFLDGQLELKHWGIKLRFGYVFINELVSI